MTFIVSEEELSSELRLVVKNQYVPRAFMLAASTFTKFGVTRFFVTVYEHGSPENNPINLEFDSANDAAQAALAIGKAEGNAPNMSGVFNTGHGEKDRGFLNIGVGANGWVQVD